MPAATSRTHPRAMIQRGRLARSESAAATASSGRASSETDVVAGDSTIDGSGEIGACAQGFLDGLGLWPMVAGGPEGFDPAGTAAAPGLTGAVEAGPGVVTGPEVLGVF